MNTLYRCSLLLLFLTWHIKRELKRLVRLRYDVKYMIFTCGRISISNLFPHSLCSTPVCCSIVPHCFSVRKTLFCGSTRAILNYKTIKIQNIYMQKPISHPTTPLNFKPYKDNWVVKEKLLVLRVQRWAIWREDAVVDSCLTRSNL